MKKITPYLLGASLLGGLIYANHTMKTQSALFAGGCFWCMEEAFRGYPGIVNVEAGYAGGTQNNPTYKTYANSGHVEVVHITYNPSIIDYNTLLNIFWRAIDPTDAGGQFGDRGSQYRSIIFYGTEEEENKARTSKKHLDESGRFTKPIVTEILRRPTFYKAEEYHQNYAEKNPIRYKTYNYFSGRDAFFKKHWSKDPKPKKTYDPDLFKKPTDQELRKQLTPLEYKVTQQEGTEPPFTDKRLYDTEPGIYVDIVSGEPLFSSLDKYDSRTGWPSFTKPLESANIVEKEQKGWLGTRTEVRSRIADSHLGHVFTDGPAPTGLRYCINSVALEFVPLEHLEKRGYGKFISLFS